VLLETLGAVEKLAVTLGAGLGSPTAIAVSV
jgi:hypothetical protein